jgi:hypothetical protein
MVSKTRTSYIGISLAEEHYANAGRYNLVLANPPFAGAIHYESCAKDPKQIFKTKKPSCFFSRCSCGCSKWADVPPLSCRTACYSARPKLTETCAGWSSKTTSLSTDSNRWHRAAVEFGHDGFGRFGPDKGFGAGVLLGEISIDRGLQVGDRAEDAAADALPRYLGKGVRSRHMSAPYFGGVARQRVSGASQWRSRKGSESPASASSARANVPSREFPSQPLGPSSSYLCPSLTKSNRRGTDPYARW